MAIILNDEQMGNLFGVKHLPAFLRGTCLLEELLPTMKVEFSCMPRVCL